MYRLTIGHVARSLAAVAVLGILLTQADAAAQRAQDTSTGGSTDQPALVTFPDSASTAQFGIAPWAGEANAGSFTFTVPNVGVYAGAARLAFHGDQTASVTGSYTVSLTPDGSSASEPVVLHIAGTIDPVGYNADLTFRFESGPLRAYRLKTLHLSAASAAPVAQQATNDINTQNWTSLYALSWSLLQGSIAQSDFVQSVGSMYPQIASITATGPGSVSSNPLGFDEYREPVVFTMVAADGTQSTVDGTLILVCEAGQWRFASADPQS
jgi:hypothetical protein